MKLKKLALAIAILNIIDAITTCYAVNKGFAKEVNPLLAPLVNYSLPLFFGLKIIVSGLIYKYISRIKVMSIILLLAYSLVCISNLLQLILFWINTGSF